MPTIELQAWSEESLSLLEGLNTPEMTKFLGGPESQEKLLRRHKRYLEAAESPTVRVFKIAYGPDLLPVGQVCYWEKNWRDHLVWESGWGVLPAYQGQGIATQALTLLLERARSERRHRFLHAFPSVENAASNALCRKLGFSKIEECDFEYPPGHPMRCNDWQIDLFGENKL
ncbi:MAG: GNAT family N-acetyltransferase [Anaerolineales bacterium]|jgi:RimJ/RimL family protein N-acetyltransferase